MTGFAKIATDRTLKAWLSAGPVDRGVGDGLTFVATAAGAQLGKASWILRYRYGGRHKEKVIGRYPDISLKDARDLARHDRAQLQQGVDVAASKRREKLKAVDMHDVAGLATIWYERDIVPKYKYPLVVERVIRRHIKPVIGRLPVEEVRPVHIDDVITRIVNAGAPTVANDALRYLFRMFHFAVKRKWIDSNPAYGFELSDAGGTEMPRGRWLTREELSALSKAMRDTPNFGRQNELSVWLLLALCVRKMELLSARWTEFDLEKRVWKLQPSRTKMNSAIDIPLAPAVAGWLEELRVYASGSDHLFPARRLIHLKNGQPRKNRFQHVSPDTLNVALRRLKLDGVEHFTVHDMRRTARTHMAALGVDRFVAERALNHKVRDVEGVYNRYDYFEERKDALSRWAMLLDATSKGQAFNVVGIRQKTSGWREGPGRSLIQGSCWRRRALGCVTHVAIGLFAPVRFPVAARVNKRAFAAKARRTRRRRLGYSRQDCLTSCDESGHLLVIKQCDPMDPSPPLANKLDKDVAMHGYDLACMRHQSVSLRRQLDDV